jgi:hypothetical protein
MFGADTKDWVEMEDYGFSQNTLNYYEDNKAAIDTAALIGGSFIPGLASIKALKMAQAYGKTTPGIARLLGYTSRGKDLAVDAAHAEIAKGSLSMTGALNAAKYRAVAYGFGEQALQAATWELATVATMQGNSAIEAQDWKQLSVNMAWGTVAGGAIGGALDSIATLSGIKKVALQKEFGEKVYEISKRAGMGDFAQGDSVQVMLDSVFSKPVPGVDTSAAGKLKSTLTGALQTAKEQLGLATKTGDDTVLSSAFVDSLTSVREQALKAGHADDAIRDEFNKQLRGWLRLSRVNEADQLTLPTAALDVRRKGVIQQFGSADDAMQAVKGAQDSDFLWFSANRSPDMPMKVAYADDGISIRQAKADAADIFIDAKGKVRVLAGDVRQVAYPGQNRPLTFAEAMERSAATPAGKLNIIPRYQVTQGQKGKLTSSLYTDLRTGEVFDEPFKVWSLADEARTLELTADGAGLLINKTDIQKFNKTQVIDYAATGAKELTARWAWVAAHVGKEGQEQFTKIVSKADPVDVTDLPRLEALQQYLQTNKIESLDVATQKMPLIQRRDPATGEEELVAMADLGDPLLDNATSVLGAIIEQTRREVITDMAKAGKSIDEIALASGADKRFVERMLANDPSTKSVPIAKVELKSYLAPTRAKLDYDVSAFTSDVQGNRIFGELDQSYRMAVAKDRMDTVAAAFFGREFEKLRVNAPVTEASTDGARPGVLSATNEDAETLGGKMQFVGAQLTRIIRETTRKVSEEISSYMTAVVSSPAAGAEYAALRATMSRTGERFRVMDPDYLKNSGILDNPQTYIPQEMRQAIQQGKSVMLWAKGVKRDANGAEYFDVRDLPASETGYVIAGGATASVAKNANQAVKMTAYVIDTPEAAQLLKQEARLNSRRMSQSNSLRAAQGRAQLEVFEDGVYFPPVNTKRYPHFAFVRKETLTVLDEKEELSFLVAGSAEELKTKIATLPSDYRAITKDQAADYKKLMKDFDYDLVVNSAAVDSDLKKRGVLSEFYPRANYQELLQDSLDHHLRMEARLVRDHMEAANAELFATLRGCLTATRQLQNHTWGLQMRRSKIRTNRTLIQLWPSLNAQGRLSRCGSMRSVALATKCLSCLIRCRKPWAVQVRNLRMLTTRGCPRRWSA